METLRPIWQSAIQVDTSQFEGTAAVRCTVGVAMPLFIGLTLGQPLISAFGAIGAVSVGFGSFQGAYRSRAAVMIAAAVGMALSVFVGSLTGHSDLATIMTALGAGFAGGMLIALGPSASFVGLQCVVAVLIAAGFPADARGATLRALIVLGGGLVQTLLVVLIWPLRRFSAERRAIATAYRSLAHYASSIPANDQVAPEPHTFAATLSPLVDPQPFARAGDVLVFQALLDEAERIRTNLAGLATRHRRLLETHPSCADSLAELSGRVLLEIAMALEDGRVPKEQTPIWTPLEQCARQLSDTAPIESLLGQMRAAWRTAGVMTAPEDDPAVPLRLPPLRRSPPLRDALTTLRANLTLRSTTFRHALRLAVTIAVAAAAYRLLQLPRGYWIPMTALLVLRPEFHDTFARGLARVIGTIVGAALATVIVEVFAPAPLTLTILVLGFVWGCYALFRINYAIFTVCLTGYVVFILMLSGIPEMTAATLRAVYTIAGGALALIAYAVWPTWAGSTARSSLAEVLDAHGAYVQAVLTAFADPGTLDLHGLGQIRADARLARSNAEAVIERMIAEPVSRASMAPRVAVGLLAALRRHSLAALSLQAGLERGVSQPVPGMALLTSQITESLSALAAALRSGGAPQPLPPLRQTQLAVAPPSDELVGQETDLMVDSINTMAELLTRDAGQARQS